jgi:hypothetical protein
MTHWGWYWKYKKKHKPKALCSWSSLNAIDSFEIFKNKEGLTWVRNSPGRLLFEIYSPYRLKVRLLDNDRLQGEFEGGYYEISVESKPCNFGGSYYFFRCPQCDKRMRKLYCVKGQYQCRKCANLGYYTQRLRPEQRNMHMGFRIERGLKERGGSLECKPPRMKKHTFRKLKKKCVDYQEKRFYAGREELIAWCGVQVAKELDSDFGWFVPNELYDVYDSKD